MAFRNCPSPPRLSTEQELRGFWANRRYPTLIRFTYNAALKKRLTRADLTEHNVFDSGITRAFFDSYLDGREHAMAIAVKNPKRYAKPKNIEDVSGSPTPPQSFQYLAAEAEV
ncbi:hypothetical protein [Corallococcus sp. RDP092CA]|uniref:hypothetical protein n=1 Tax=Corallococcus sp. RDP092CA TaxID=3109369 RepID=UPI0035B0362C